MDNSDSNYQDRTGYPIREHYRDTPPWTGASMYEIAANYGEYQSDDAAWASVDQMAAEDWAAHGHPQDGQSPHAGSEYSWNNGQLWFQDSLPGRDGQLDAAVPVWSAPPAGVETDGRAR